MPLMNGIDLLYEIKNSKEIINMPYCIALTAYSLKNDREKYIQLGFNDYISKPIDFSLLSNSLYNFCNKHDLKFI
jgi:CheY-like chemotaxis protein